MQSDVAVSVQSDATAAAVSASSHGRRRVFHALWHGRSLQAQLLIVFAIIDLIAILVAGGVIILRARTQIRIEMTASMRLAEFLVGDAAHLAQQQVSAEEFLAALPAQLRSIRHARIVVTDAAGVPVAVPPPGGLRSEGREPVPRWFTALVSPAIETHEVAVMVNGARIGEVEIVGEPADETAEVWENVLALGAVALVLNAAMIGILYFLFGRVLDPLTVLAGGLADLEHQTYSVRLPRPHAPELAAIAERFNALALALEEARGENVRLNRRLISAQDDERRRTALELHDEVGPCLFGLKANASTIAGAAAGLPATAQRSIAEPARDILAIIDHLQVINRSMLDRLRPMALGHVPLADIIGEMVRERARGQPQTAFAFAPAKNLGPSYGDSIDLTVYRCIQESLTNVVRHAQAKHVTVDLAEARDGGGLALTVRDDGRGLEPGVVPGFGIRGMQERVVGLGGAFAIDSSPEGGTSVRIAIPFNAAADEADGRTS